MKKNKYIFKILSLVLIILMLFGCGKKIEQPTEPTTSNVVTVMFPEGYTVTDIAKKLEASGVCSAQDFMNETNNTEYLEMFGISIDSPSDRTFLLEGYLFPDTYEFYLNENVSSVIKKFLRNTQTKLSDSIIQRCDELGYSVDEIITLASIIQKESGGNAQVNMISSVLHNRLNSPKFSQLECDACSFYLRDSVKPYVSDDKFEEYLQTYSTYNCLGLPEGPIANPGIKAINAALYPADSEYFYFLTDPDGNYHYSVTIEQHKALAKQYGY